MPVCLLCLPGLLLPVLLNLQQATVNPVRYPDSTLKIRDITFLTKVCLVKAVFYPVVMYRYKRWTIKKTEHQRIEAFQLWCWRRLLRVPWTAKISNQSILKEINPEYS